MIFFAFLGQLGGELTAKTTERVLARRREATVRTARLRICEASLSDLVQGAPQACRSGRPHFNM